MLFNCNAKYTGVHIVTTTSIKRFRIEEYPDTDDQRYSEQPTCVIHCSIIACVWSFKSL